MPAINSVKTTRLSDGRTRVTVSASSNATLVELVIYEAGIIRVVPLSQASSTWSATLNMLPDARFLIQAASSTGGVRFDTNRDRLYRPQAPVSTASLQIEPVSGNWNYPVAFEITNTGQESIELQWLLDCWNPWQMRGVCGDFSGATTLAAGESVTKGLGMVCAWWQLDLEYGQGKVWGGIAEMPPACSGARTISLPLRR